LGGFIMNGNTHRSTTARFGSLLLLAAAALAGCATTGGAATSASAFGNAAHPLAAQATTPTGYVVCAGGSASRFPQREQTGRVCRPSPSLLHAIY
jgi:hypothetical protein